MRPEMAGVSLHNLGNGEREKVAESPQEEVDPMTERLREIQSSFPRSQFESGDVMQKLMESLRPKLYGLLQHRLLNEKEDVESAQEEQEDENVDGESAMEEEEGVESAPEVAERIQRMQSDVKQQIQVGFGQDLQQVMIRFGKT